MIKGKDFIVFADDWGRHPSSCQHIMRRLLRHNRVLWVNTVGMRSPNWSLPDLRRSFEKVSGWFASPTNESNFPDNLSVVSLPGIPYHSVRSIRRLNAVAGLAVLRRAIHQHCMRAPIVITAFPTAVDFVNCLGEVGSIYYCVDEFASYPGLPARAIAAMETELLQKVDLVIATSRELQRRKSASARRTVLVPHGVDVEHFGKENGLNGSRVPFMEGIKKPIVGFFGVIDDWVDLKLIAESARLRDDWSWVLIGPAQTSVHMLRDRPNVHLLGAVSYRDLPRYTRYFDVGIIPFLVNDLTINVNPLKILEYLACGLPVVSTPIPEITRYGDMVAVAETPVQFVSAIEGLLATNVPERIEARIALAASNSWEARAANFSRHIECLLDDGNDNA